MAKPVRVQLSRRKGFKLQQHSMEVNGLPAAKVSRPTPFGNPWTVAGAREAGYSDNVERLTDWCTSLFREWVEESPSSITRMLEGSEKRLDKLKRRLPELRGKNLACWCAMPQPGEPDRCHATVLLRLANPVCEEVTDAA